MPTSPMTVSTPASVIRPIRSPAPRQAGGQRGRAPVELGVGQPDGAGVDGDGVRVARNWARSRAASPVRSGSVAEFGQVLGGQPGRRGAAEQARREVPGEPQLTARLPAEQAQSGRGRGGPGGGDGDLHRAGRVGGHREPREAERRRARRAGTFGGREQPGQVDAGRGGVAFGDLPAAVRAAARPALPAMFLRLWSAEGGCRRACAGPTRRSTPGEADLAAGLATLTAGRRRWRPSGRGGVHNLASGRWNSETPWAAAPRARGGGTGRRSARPGGWSSGGPCGSPS